MNRKRSGAALFVTLLAAGGPRWALITLGALAVPSLIATVLPGARHES